MAGLGFAGALAEIATSGEIPLALFAFNVGVDQATGLRRRHFPSAAYLTRIRWRMSELAPRAAAFAIEYCIVLDLARWRRDLSTGSQNGVNTQFAWRRDVSGQARLFTARGNSGSRQILRLGAIVAKMPPERLLELLDSFQHVEVLQEK